MAEGRTCHQASSRDDDGVACGMLAGGYAREGMRVGMTAVQSRSDMHDRGNMQIPSSTKNDPNDGSLTKRRQIPRREWRQGALPNSHGNWGERAMALRNEHPHPPGLGFCLQRSSLA